MAYLHEHCADCRRLLGNEWKEVHKWLDALYKEYGQSHRCHRHHAEGIEEVCRMWGEEAEMAAKIHIIVDCWGIPSQADYESGRVNVNGFTQESTEADVALLLDEIRKIVPKMKLVDEKIRGWSVLISELPLEDQEPYRRHIAETAPRACPAPLPGDVPGDLRTWRSDYKRWKKGLYGIEWLD